MFVAAWFATAPHWKQPKCSAAGEWIRSCTHTAERHSAQKRDGLGLCTAPGMVPQTRCRGEKPGERAHAVGFHLRRVLRQATAPLAAGVGWVVTCTGVRLPSRTGTVSPWIWHVCHCTSRFSLCVFYTSIRVIMNKNTNFYLKPEWKINQINYSRECKTSQLQKIDFKILFIIRQYEQVICCRFSEL